MKILVVDDETPILEAIAYNLRKEGYEALTATDADQAMELALARGPDLIVLDVMLPSASGFDVCRTLRTKSKVPIILLTARAEEADRIVGLELGADDYVTKPFSMRELLARIKTILRRSSGEAEPVIEPIRFSEIAIDTNRHEVTVHGKVVEMPRKEFELLRFLAENPNKVFSRQTLLDRVWGADAYVGEKTVDVHVRWIREKIETDPAAPEHILTVRGVGYRLKTMP